MKTSNSQAKTVNDAIIDLYLNIKKRKQDKVIRNKIRILYFIYYKFLKNIFSSLIIFKLS